MSGWLGLLLLGAGGCNKDQEAPSFATYNAGLAIGFVRAARQRTPLAAEAIGDLDADVICLQEVWTPEQIDAVAEAATDHPHQLWPAPQPERIDTAGCDTDDIAALEGCLDDNCADTCPDELLDCFLESCGFTFLTVSETCQGCVMANVSDDREAVVDACSVRTDTWAYEGSFGTAILSKHPVKGFEELILDATTTRRSVLHAEVELPDGPVDAYCTHLTADLAPLPYTGPADSWGDENTRQVTAMMDWVSETRQHPVVLMGDFNTGPAVGAMTAELPESWAAIEAAGFDVPFLESAACTVCADNPLRGIDSVEKVIDHVLFDGFDSASARRLLDETLTVTSCEAPLEAALSDHYAVEAVATPVR